MSELADTNRQTVLRWPSHDVSACDPTLLFAIKALLYPLTAVAFLVLCLWLWRRPLIGAYFLIAVMTFTAVGELLDFSKIEDEVPTKSALRTLRYIATRWFGLIFCIFLLLHLSRVQVHLVDPPLLVWLMLTPLVLWCGQLGIWRLLLDVGVKYMKVRRAIIIGFTKHGRLLHEMLGRQPLLNIQSLGFFDDTNQDSTHATHVLGRMQDVSAFVRKHQVQLVYITLPISSDSELVHLLDELHDSVASVYFVPDLFAMRPIETRLEVVHGIPMIAVCESPFYGAHALVKRCSDIILSSLILLITAPLLMIIAVAIKWTSRGPVIFKQRRYGLDGREIDIYKFRSLNVTEDGAQSYRQVTRDDDRVTKVGAFLRRTSLDELPQFFNVLMGSMSVVGPRPHAIAVNERYRAQIPSYMIRHKVKPGITGWAQVNGYRGGDDLPTMTKRIEFDLDYLSNWSLWLDLKIILRTVAVVLRDSHAF